MRSEGIASPAGLTVGRLAAYGAFVTSTAYGVAQLLQLAGVLRDPLDRILIFAPSLALAPCFVVAMAAATVVANPRQETLRLAGLALATLYAGLASIVYITQLGVVIPREMAHASEAYPALACCGFRQPTTVLDLLGYTYMSLATLIAAPSYSGALRWCFVLNGLLAPVVFLQLVWPSLIWLASPWLVVFPIAMLLLARSFSETVPCAPDA